MTDPTLLRRAEGLRELREFLTTVVILNAILLYLFLVLAAIVTIVAQVAGYPLW